LRELVTETKRRQQRRNAETGGKTCERTHPAVARRCGRRLRGLLRRLGLLASLRLPGLRRRLRLTPDTLATAYPLRFGIVRGDRAESKQACQTERRGSARYRTGRMPNLIDELLEHKKPPQLIQDTFVITRVAQPRDNNSDRKLID
jgi:hypothetical protein